MAGTVCRGLRQLGKGFRHVQLRLLMQQTVKTFSSYPSTGPYSDSDTDSDGESNGADKYITAGFDFGDREMFGPAWGHDVPKGPDGLPLWVDWTKVRGAVTLGQDQGNAGICYNFAPVESVRSLHFIETGRSRRLSFQQVLDCHTLRSLGVHGGLPERVLEYIKKCGILPSAKYPFTGVRGTCKGIKGPGVTIAEFKFINPDDEAAVKYCVAYQPVVANIRAQRIRVGDVTMKFSQYKKGIIHGRGTTKLDHSVLLAGYHQTDGEDGEDGEEYWIGVNTHGRKWGQGSIFWLARGTGQKRGALGVLHDTMIPLRSSRRTVIATCDSCAKCLDGSLA